MRYSRQALCGLALVALAAAMLVRPTPSQENDPAAPGREERILKQLQDDKPCLRFQAVYCLLHVKDPTPLLPAVRAVAEDEAEDFRVRQAALTVLSDSGVELPEVTLDLRQAVLTPGDAAERDTALYTLRRTEGDEAALEVLGSLLESEDASERLWAARALRSVGGQAKTELIMAHLDDPDDMVRVELAQTLAREGETALAVTTFAELLGSPDEDVVRRALGRLGTQGPVALAALDHITERLTHESGAVREQALRALRRVGADAQAASVEIIASLHTAVVQREIWQCARALLDVAGPEAAAAEALARGQDDDEGAHEAMLNCIIALAGVVPPELLEASLGDLVREIQDNAYGLRPACAHALGSLGSLREAVDELVAVLGDPPSEEDVDALRMAFAAAIKGNRRHSGPVPIDLLAPEAPQRGGLDPVPVLTDLLAHESPVVRSLAAGALGDVETGADALPMLVRVSENDPDEGVRDRASMAVAALDPEEATLPDTPLAVTESNAKQVCLGLLSFAIDYDGYLPGCTWVDGILPYMKSHAIMRSAGNPEQYPGFALNAKVAGLEVSEIEQPGATVLIFEAEDALNHTLGVADDVADWHDGHVVVGFVDGHVEELPVEEVRELLSPE